VGFIGAPPDVGTKRSTGRQYPFINMGKQHMSGALRAVLVTFLLFAAAAPFTNADCPDATIRCRIALSDL